MPTVLESLENLLSAGITTTERTKGCSDSEIEQIESSLNVKLPTSYKEFLKFMGKGAGDFLVGTDLFSPMLPTLRAWAEDLLSRTDSRFRLPGNAFIFLVHQGYQFMYFLLDTDDDPEVFYYEEGDTAPRLVIGRFTEWLASTVDDEINVRRNAGKVEL